MSRSASPLLAVCALLGACSQCGPQQPRAARSPTLTDAQRAVLPVNDAGLPVVYVAPGTGGLVIGLAYDEKRDDPMTRWGECIGRVGDCYETNHGQLGGCVDFIPRCATNAGGSACCPGACIDAFKKLVESGVADKDAVDQTFAKGDCVDGYAAFIDAGVQP